MQIQPKISLRQSGDSRRARQAALLAEDVFRGGTRAMPRTPALQRPWLSGPGHLWDAARKRAGDASAE